MMFAEDYLDADHSEMEAEFQSALPPFYSISIEIELARQVILDLAKAFIKRHLNWHNLTKEGDGYVTWGIPLSQHNWRTRMDNSLAECGLINNMGFAERRIDLRWQIWIEGKTIGLPTTWEDSAKWVAILQNTFPDHRICNLPLQVIDQSRPLG